MWVYFSPIRLQYKPEGASCDAKLRVNSRLKSASDGDFDARNPHSWFVYYIVHMYIVKYIQVGIF